MLVKINLTTLVVLISLNHQEEHLELKSPVTTGKDGLRSFLCHLRASEN